MKKTITILLLCCSLASVFACSCMPNPFGVQSIINSDLFIKGKIVGKTEDQMVMNENDTSAFGKMKIGLFKYEIEVSDYVKGGGDKIIYVYSMKHGVSCGVNYAVGDEMYIFVYKEREREKYRTSSCARNFTAERGSKEPNYSIIRDYKKSAKFRKWKNERGVIDAEGEISNGIPVGVWKFYHADGSLSSMGTYKNGEKKGTWGFYYTDGSLSSIGGFQKGKKEGEWKYYLDKKRSQEAIAEKGSVVKNEEGNVLRFIKVYKNGKELGREAGLGR